MKDTIRLSQRNKDRLQFYDDDGNRAIEKVLDAYDSAQVRESTRKEFEPLLHATSFQTGTSSCSAPMSLSASYTANMFDPTFWKKMKTTVDDSIESAKRY